jgi:hypothetical protein
MRTHPIVTVAVAAVLCVAASTFAQDAPPRSTSADDVMEALKRTLAWYQQARLAMQSVNDAAGGLIVREDEQTVLRVFQRAFDTARAQAKLLTQSGTTA